MRIAKNIALVLILIFVLSGLTASSFICYAELTENKREYYMELARNDPCEALGYIGHYKNQPWAEEVIRTAAENCPSWKALWFVWLDELGAQIIIETVAENDPEQILRLEEIFWMKVEKAFKDSKQPIIKAVLAIRNSCYPNITKERISVMLEKIVNEDMTLEEATEIARDDKKFFRALMQIKNKPNYLRSKPNYLGRMAVDEGIKEVALQIVRRINDLHNEPDIVRFESVKGANSQELYIAMVYGEEEIFTSSFNGLFDRLLDAMEREEINGDELLEKLGHNKFRTFIKLCTGFNRLNEFLETMDENSRRVLLEKFVKDIDKEKDSLEQAVVIADTFSMLEDKEILKVLQETIKSEYERTNSEGIKEGKILYGLLAGMFGEKAVINEAWIKEMAEKYQLPDLTRILSKELFNSNGLDVQQYFFYNDKDGRASFWSFLSQYRGKPGWKIEEKENFIHITSTRNGKKIEIYANKPKAAENGPEEIAKIFKERNIQPVVVVHRGHSYHVQKSIERISSSARIVSLGSCGGYNNISAVMGRASEAHIISTKATGTMLVNDPLLKMLNEEILTGKDIYWPEFWQKAEERLEKIGDFQNYIPPHKNLGVMFLKVYYRLLEKD